MDRITPDQQVLNACAFLRTQSTTPKIFIRRFIESQNGDIAYLRRFWALERGIHSSIGLVRSLGHQLRATETGRMAWEQFIEEEVGPQSPLAYATLAILITVKLMTSFSDLQARRIAQENRQGH
ncbi:hypothetical protein MJO28_007333 [Puccinia striiformis f. sp. tritici]|uniref:Uncharacterized protein n=1 Tax=Puccinia striiformis f. sp. tritici TaxID=168172 RepID=A0ACC0EDR2_9BASI|nr:hypothetical protein MJO29_016954 [Puccinia striiformis f. sp. tritici]KAI7951649.1 hypothetical protein MJO28_007333 [Puccinia striiformis f. sp. tritici]KAI7955876.1 hypothetical protein MJO29_007275 [Puccinia striiformis f. sp. tritici]KAI9603824.1 hypothetical protein H4Q26_003428 [Puccinia striiformis f. sp. tritici PST-130]